MIARRMAPYVALELLAMLAFSPTRGFTQAVPPDSSRAVLDADSAKTGKGKKAGKKAGKKSGAKKLKLPTMKMSGYIQVFFKARRDADGNGTVEPSVFRAQRVRLGFQGDVTPHVSYDIEIDPRSPEINGVLRDAYVSVDYIPHHELRIGQQKTLFGYENVVSSTKLFVVNRSEVSDGLSRGITLRDIGLGLLGSFKMTDNLRFEDQLSVVNGEGMNVQADSTGTKNLWGRLGLRYKSGETTVRFGASAAKGDQRDGGDPAIGEPAFFFTFDRLGADFEIDHPRAFFASEFVSGNDKVKDQPDAGGSSIGYYALIAGKTRWRVGPIFRFEGLEEFRRYTAGGYLGLPADPVSLLLNYEVLKDDLGKHDDKFYLRLQVRF